MTENLVATPPAAGTINIPGLVDEVLADFLATSTATLAAWDSALCWLADAARDAVLGGGKRLRPTFAYWGWRGVAGPAAPVDTVLPALAALEFLHAFALVHDDVMDASATRRGRPTTHRAFANLHTGQGWRGEADRFGDGAAILVGDLCLVWADQLIAASALPGHRLAAARACYDRMRLEAIAGQFLDLLGGAQPAWTVERSLLTIRLKTASYTTVRPLHYGAALAGAPPGDSLHRAYTGYGLAVGEAFQLRDDLLGLTGDPAETGKPVGDDSAGHKATVVSQLARSLAEGPDGDPTPSQTAAAVRRSGAVDRVEEMIAERVAAALAALDQTPIHPDARAALTDLAKIAAWRSA
ncbi:polyprenyl synthetase family protein [Phytohabitans houttuyneae]|nr:polyprenyl synthetase family protein [Phytohabitans houttuyneae]